MTTIVLVTIGILLASAAALMTTWYGGEAFNQGDAKARADTLMNAGTNIRSSANLYMIRKGKLPDRPSNLIDTKATQVMPTINGIGATQDAWLDLTVDDGRPRKAYAVTGVNEKVCGYVNANVQGGARRVLDAPQGLSGCYRQGDDNVYYAMLSDAAPNVGAIAGGVACRNPGTGDSDTDAFNQSCYLIRYLMQSAQAMAIASGSKEDLYLDGGGGALTKGAIESVLYKPNGGTFGNKAYITFYLNRDTNSNFCKYWNMQLKPHGAENCTNWYNNKIVFHLTDTWTGGG